MKDANGPVPRLGHEALRFAIDRVRREGDCEFEIPVEGAGAVHVRGRRYPGSVSLTLEDADRRSVSVTTSFDPAPERPERYPDDLPFLAGVRTHASRSRAGGWRAVVWEVDAEGGTGARGARLVQEIVRQSVDAGWSVQSEGGVSVRLTSGGTTRTVTHLPLGPLADTVTLLERREA